MNSDREKIIKIACVYSGTILGAGFASGQELLSFFAKYGKIGILGLIVSGILFSAIGIRVLKCVFYNKIKNYPEFVRWLMGKNLGRFMEIVVFFFLMTLFSTMFAAGGAAVNSAFGLSKFIGVIIISLLCFITLLFDVNGIIEINVILCPVLMIGGIFIGIYSYITSDTYVFSHSKDIFYFINNNWFVSAIIYVSYNVITAISVLVSLNKFVINKKIAFFGGALGGLSMCILGICMTLPLLVHNSKTFGEMPMFDIISNYNMFFRYFYILILLAAIFTTAVGNGFAAVEWIHSRFKINPLYIKILVCIFAVIISQAGFSNFVNKVYPLFGYIGIFEIIMILLKPIKTSMKTQKL